MKNGNNPIRIIDEWFCDSESDGLPIGTHDYRVIAYFDIVHLTEVYDFAVMMGVGDGSEQV